MKPGTTWTYDNEGRMKTKQYPGQAFANLEYGYNADGTVAWRKFWSSSTVNKMTSYTYDNVGNVTIINYPTMTDVTLQYDAANQLTNMVDAAGTTRFTYTDAGDLLSEDATMWASAKVTYGYDPNVPHLRTGLTLQQPALTWAQTYGYEGSHRLQTLTSPAGSFTYTYWNAGNLWTNLALPGGPAITNGFDNVARLTSTVFKLGNGTVMNSHAYICNDGFQRTRQTRTDGSYVTYGYDDDGQVQTAVGAGGDTLNLGFSYDAAWNMTQRTSGGTPVNYTIYQNMNQVTGDGTYTYGYDANGNQTSKSPGCYYTYTYDEENRVSSLATDTYYTPEGSRWKTEFVYDGRSRLRVRKEYIWMYSAWQTSSQTRYLYDGMRVIQERNTANTPTVSYTRGTDLSGSLERAGGIGGLLARSHGYSGGTWSTHNWYHADGNGNITYLYNNTSGMVANYRYDPFGRTLTSGGTLASANVYRFSSKEVHAQSGYYYYGYRFYDPNLQRWLNRDPIQEDGGINIYGCNSNDSINNIDPYGLYIRVDNSFMISKCEIVIFYGHGTCVKDKYRFDLPVKGGAVGVVTCFRDNMLEGVPEDKILGGVVSLGNRAEWNMPKGGAIRNTANKDNGEGIYLFDANAELEREEKMVGDKARELCEGCKCKQVVLHYVKNGNAKGMPKRQDAVFDCDKYK